VDRLEAATAVHSPCKKLLHNAIDLITIEGCKDLATVLNYASGLCCLDDGVVAHLLELSSETLGPPSPLDLLVSCVGEVRVRLERTTLGDVAP
jgi:hypothetical protein